MEIDLEFDLWAKQKSEVAEIFLCGKIIWRNLWRQRCFSCSVRRCFLYLKQSNILKHFRKYRWHRNKLLKPRVKNTSEANTMYLSRTFITSCKEQHQLQPLVTRHEMLAMGANNSKNLKGGHFWGQDNVFLQSFHDILQNNTNYWPLATS